MGLLLDIDFTKSGNTSEPSITIGTILVQLIIVVSYLVHEVAPLSPALYKYLRPNAILFVFIFNVLLYFFVSHYGNNFLVMFLWAANISVYSLLNF